MDCAKILIADDSEEARELLHDLFSVKGHEVIDAIDGKEAMNLFDSTQPDIVMLDIMMPQYSGIEVLKYIKDRSPGTPVVVMTAYGTEEKAVEAMKLGADDYLSKPLSYKDVVVLVEDLLEKNRVKFENIRLKEKIHETERYLAHLVDIVNEAIISCDSKGNVLSFNRAAEKLWHFDEEEIVGKHLSFLFKDGKKNGYVDKVIEFTKKDGKYDGEFMFCRKDLADFPGYLSTSLMEDDSLKDDGIVALIRDLTNEKRLSEQLVASARLASLGKVVEGIAHEVRNPLLSMGGFARRMNKTIDKDSDYGHYLKVILHDVNRLEKMVHDIEEYAHFAKEHRANFHCVNLTEIVDCSLASLLEEGKGIKKEITQRDLPMIFGDERSLGELFHNLFENSIEAMPEGGKLKVDFTLDDDYINVIISDTGCGIPEEKVEDIYDPFYTSKMSGVGIGLAKAYIIIEEHFGFINVDSMEGKGTAFTVGFPRERRQLVRV